MGQTPYEMYFTFSVAFGLAMILAVWFSVVARGSAPDDFQVFAFFAAFCFVVCVWTGYLAYLGYMQNSLALAR